MQLFKSSLLQPFVFTIIVLLEIAACEKILFFNGFASHSHLVAFEPLANTLADRGHNVTIVSPMISENTHPKIVHYCPQSVLQLQGSLNDLETEVLKERLKGRYNDFFMNTDILWDGNVELCKAFYRSPEFQDWIKTSEFDLVIIDAFSRECALPLTYAFKARSIIFSPSSFAPYDPEVHGWAAEASSVLPFSEHRYYSDSFQTEITNLGWYLWKEYKFVPRFNTFFWNELKWTEMPSVSELERNVSLFMVNVHFSMEGARSLPPFVIPVGGMHCRESKGIQDTGVRTFVEDSSSAGSSDGFLFISFGSFIRVSSLPPKYLGMIIDSIRSLPKLKFLIKWEVETPEKGFFPENVYMSKWFKQQDLLAHPKCKGFITHGGLMSFQQAVYHGVPIIVIPGAGDQGLNARQAATNGNGIHLEISDMTLDALTDAIHGLVYTDKYSKAAKEVSRQFKDRPMSPVKTAVWWTEYVLRHDNLSNLKPKGMNQYWWERRMLHFWGLAFLMIASAVAVLGILLRCLISLTLSGSGNKRDANKAKSERKSK